MTMRNEFEGYFSKIFFLKLRYSGVKRERVLIVKENN
jgi:hypothetical protein